MQSKYSYRTIISFYLTVLYTAVIFKPVIPIVSDSIEHFFAEAEHIATVHAIYGANHLQKELDETSSDTKDKNQNTTKIEDLTSVHVITSEITYTHPSIITTNYSRITVKKIEDVFITMEAPPPKFDL